MTSSTNELVLAAVMEALALMQEQLGGIQSRLDTIDAAQAGVTDLEPMLETLLSRVMDGQASTRKGMESIARVAAFAHAAAAGNPAPLPSDLLADPLLERFRREMPAELQFADRALQRWSGEAAKLSSLDLAVILTQQFEASPTETVEDLALRYRMAAVSRAELQRRHLAVPQFPEALPERDKSPTAAAKRAEHLAALWRAGPSAQLYGEAELAGAVDVFEQLDAAGEITAARIEDMHRKMGNHIADGQRLTQRLRSAFADDEPPIARDGPKR